MAPEDEQGPEARRRDIDERQKGLGLVSVITSSRCRWGLRAGEDVALSLLRRR